MAGGMQMNYGGKFRRQKTEVRRQKSEIRNPNPNFEPQASGPPSIIVAKTNGHLLADYLEDAGPLGAALDDENFVCRKKYPPNIRPLWVAGCRGLPLQVNSDH